MKTIALIPARYDSQRFPGKILYPLHGRPMIDHVYDRVSASGVVSEVVVVTDDHRIFRHCRSRGMEVRLSSACHPSGTDRIAEVAPKLEADYILNVQGDEPLVHGEHLSLLVQGLEKGFGISTIAVPNSSLEDYRDPNVVKVVPDAEGKALYFSRASIPYYRDSVDFAGFLQHIGLYGFRRELLIELTSLSVSPLEAKERLEQLRWLEAGHSIFVGQTQRATRGVDRLEDVAQVEELLRFQD